MTKRFTNTLYTGLTLLIILFAIVGTAKASISNTLNSVVGIVCVHENKEDTTIGSGSVVSTYQVLTAAHVLIGCKEIEVYYRDGSNFKAQVQFVGEVKVNDVAVLTVFVPETITPLRISRKPVKYSMPIMSIGMPLGITYVITHGTVAKPDFMNDFAFLADITVYKGMSGGPVLNSKNEIVGIVSAILSTEEGGSTGFSMMMRTDNRTGWPEDLR